jgi:hypothetical protein
VASYQQTVLADNPVLYQRLNETVGTTATDITGNGHTGTYTGVWTLGVAAGGAGLGTAASSIGGTGNFIDTPANAALDITGDVTLEAWINTTASGGAQYIMSKGQTDASHGSYGVFIASSNKLTFACTEVANVVVGGSLLSLNTWYHVVCTRSANTWTIYLNGVSDGTTSSAQAVSATARNYRVSGVVEQGGTFFPFAGAVDEIALYNTGLSAAQVAAHYAARNTASGSSPGRRSAPPPFVATIPANLPPGLGGTPPGQAKKQNESPAARRRRIMDDYRRLRRRA